ncbi:hypothetical protein [Endozoicomonas sp. ALB091]|uniref:hypothetical protein n=1 Tax=Endozoicomonas sp. ALB091 TaxID=3403073 RepID=UPI003BB48F6B
MKPKHLLASSALSLIAIVGMAQADLVQDLATMPADQALTIAMQAENSSIESVISSAAQQLNNQPELLSALIEAAVKVYPLQTGQIVSAAISQAPDQKETIVNAAKAGAGNNAELMSMIDQAAGQFEQLVTALDDVETTEEIEAEQQEIAPLLPPPPPPANSGSNDRESSISDN